jgi:DNA-binding CsgD family transcriptional regulator
MANRGRPSFEVTPSLQRQVEELVACGMTENEIAGAIGCSRPTLRAHFRDQLKTGRAKRRAEVVRLLFASARRGNVAAQKKLMELTATAATEASAPWPRRLGKKEQAELDAQTAAEGTSWAELVKH